MESPRRRRIEGSARIPFLGTLPEEEWEVHHRGEVVICQEPGKGRGDRSW